MDLTAATIKGQLDLIDAQGWDSEAGAALLELVLLRVVRPIVRRSGLRGPAADQAEASGWAAAWDALRRPTAREAVNPAGMVWVAVRRAVASELASSGPGPGGVSASTDPRLAVCGEDPPPAEAQEGSVGTLGPLTDQALALLVDVGWDRAEAFETVAALADSLTGTGGGSGAVRWRLVARRLAAPEWRVRRMASLLVGGPAGPGLLELLDEQGPAILADGSVRAAARATTRQWTAVPESLLADVPRHRAGHGRIEAFAP